MLDRELFVTTDLFEVTARQPHFINDRCFGEDFAAWLRTRLAAQQIDCSEPVQEDWGWVLVATAGERCFTISIGVMDESIGQKPAQWRIGLTYERFLNKISTWFRAAPQARFDQLFAQLKAVLLDEPRFAVSETEND